MLSIKSSESLFANSFFSEMFDPASSGRNQGDLRRGEKTIGYDKKQNDEYLNPGTSHTGTCSSLLDKKCAEDLSMMDCPDRIGSFFQTPLAILCSL